MKASPEVQRHLLSLQEIDTHLRQLDYAAANLPQLARIDELQAELMSSAGEFRERSGVVEDAEREIERIETDIALVRARRETDRQREAQSSNAKDVQALEAEIASLTQRLDTLEDLELEVMQRLEDANASLAELVLSRETIESRIGEESKARDDRLAEMANERTQLLERRETLSEMIPSDVMDLYLRQRDRYGIGAALLTRGVSGGSGMALSESDLEKIRATPPDEIVLCPDSNCILVRTEESGL